MIFTRLRLCCSFVGESMHDDGCLVFAYYKEGATDPTFLYFAPSLKEVKCWRVPIAGLDVPLLALLVLVLSLNASSFTIFCSGGLEALLVLFWFNCCLETITGLLMALYALLDQIIQFLVQVCSYNFLCMCCFINLQCYLQNPLFTINGTRGVDLRVFHRNSH